MFIRTLISCLAVSLALVCTGCAEPVQAPLSKEEIADRKLMKEAYETGRQYRQQYIAAKRPVFRLKFRHQYPTMSEEEIEVLVNDALEEGLQQQAQRLGDGPVMRPPVTCTSSTIGSSTYTDCNWRDSS
jgi:hypothetical protein